ncbi:DUF2190 family protein [Methylobacterium organophilum]|uniref:capsid cement protein n=1 Tax=Methylobacterium organophilum TaxID=410 RepID=UPI001F13E585|nr:DUF2190 family protein [Methylobacterium organophilum]UMY16319.1 DUF2190 family protein [Methylobacterium organophilum]
MNALFGVAAYDAAEGTEVEVSLVGVCVLPKASGAIAEGTKAYWDSTAKAVSGTASGNKLIGATIRAAGVAEAGCSPHEIMAVLGHSTLAEVGPYTHEADRAGLSTGAITKLEGWKKNNPTQTMS